MPLKQRGVVNELNQQPTQEHPSGQVLTFVDVPSLMMYLEECTKTQISHLHVTVRRQKKITYSLPASQFVILDEPASPTNDIDVSNMFTGDILTVIFYYLRHPISDNMKQIYQSFSYKWLQTFDGQRPVIGTSRDIGITFNQLIARDDMADACLSLSVILNKSIEVIDLRHRTKNTGQDKNLLHWKKNFLHVSIKVVLSPRFFVVFKLTNTLPLFCDTRLS